MPEDQPSLFAIRPVPSLPDGFFYSENVITAEDESWVLSHLRQLPFKEFQFQGYEGKRRVVSFGWRYDFNEHKALQAEPIPSFLLEVYRKVQAASGFKLHDLQQALVTEYGAGAPIGWHKDRPVFGEVMGVSLASACLLRLRKPAGKKWERVSVRLEPRSAYFLERAARWEWEHSIPPVEALRYSITFRNLRRSSSRDESGSKGTSNGG